MRFVRSLPSVFGLAFFAWFLTVSLPDALERPDDFIEQAIDRSGETRIEERSRSWGEHYTQRIEQIRRVIPPDGVYILVNGDRIDRGAPIWVRFDLAPRRAVLLTRRHLNRPRVVWRKVPGVARWVVVAAEGRLPELIEKSRFLRHLKERR
jgi:hypothetical protein